jgi:hypothetical protein
VVATKDITIIVIEDRISNSVGEVAAVELTMIRSVERAKACHRFLSKVKSFQTFKIAKINSI